MRKSTSSGKVFEEWAQPSSFFRHSRLIAAIERRVSVTSEMVKNAPGVHVDLPHAVERFAVSGRCEHVADEEVVVPERDAVHKRAFDMRHAFVHPRRFEPP